MRNKILKTIWLIIAIASAGIAIHAYYNSGINKALQFLLVTFIALLFYFLRRNAK